MIQELKIGIVEDELLIAEKIKMILEELGYLVFEPVSSYDEAIKMIKTQKPDIVLLDINLGQEKDGIDIAEKINEAFFLPFIFLTANSDMVTVLRAKEVKPHAYLVKPFMKEELFATIEIAVNNFNTAKQKFSHKDNPDNKSFIFIRESNRYHKILFEDIAYLESKENYVIIHTKDNKSIMQRSTFSEFLSQLPSKKFFRVHRCFAIQTGLIENIDGAHVVVAGREVPFSNSYKESLFSFLGIN